MAASASLHNTHLPNNTKHNRMKTTSWNLVQTAQNRQIAYVSIRGPFCSSLFQKYRPENFSIISHLSSYLFLISRFPANVGYHFISGNYDYVLGIFY